MGLLGHIKSLPRNEAFNCTASEEIQGQGRLPGLIEFKADRLA